MHNAVLSGIKILDNKDQKQTPDNTSILADALAVSFDNHIGHDYIEDGQGADLIDPPYKEKRYKFDLDYFNRITKGGS